MPLAVAIPGTILCAVQVIQEIRGRSVPIGDDDEAPEGATGQIVARALGYLGGIALYTALIWFLGFRLASALWVLAFMRVVARMRWPAALLYTTGTLLGLELLARVLGIHLPPGRVAF